MTKTEERQKQPGAHRRLTALTGTTRRRAGSAKHERAQLELGIKIPTQKRCSGRCKQLRSWREFTKDEGSGDGLAAICNHCAGRTTTIVLDAPPLAQPQPPQSENGAAKAAYATFEALGPDRSIDAMIMGDDGSNGWTRTQLEQWAAWYGWEARAAAHDAELAHDPVQAAAVQEAQGDTAVADEATVLKTCAICRTAKPLDQFRYNAKGEFERNTYCALCDAEVGAVASWLTRHWKGRTEPRPSVPAFIRAGYAKEKHCPMCDTTKAWRDFTPEPGVGDQLSTYCTACAANKAVAVTPAPVWGVGAASEAPVAPAVQPVVVDATPRSKKRRERQIDPIAGTIECFGCGAMKAPDLFAPNSRDTITGRQTHCYGCMGERLERARAAKAELAAARKEEAAVQAVMDVEPNQVRSAVLEPTMVEPSAQQQLVVIEPMIDEAARPGPIDWIGTATDAIPRGAIAKVKFGPNGEVTIMYQNVPTVVWVSTDSRGQPVSSLPKPGTVPMNVPFEETFDGEDAEAIVATLRGVQPTRLLQELRRLRDLVKVQQQMIDLSVQEAAALKTERAHTVELNAEIGRLNTELEKVQRDLVDAQQLLETALSENSELTRTQQEAANAPRPVALAEATQAEVLARLVEIQLGSKA
jgi:hypothetical protein